MKRILAMMKFVLLVIILMMTVSGMGSMDPGQEAAVKTVFQEMLKIQPPTQQDDRKVPFVPPKHMMELYRKYASGGGPRKMNANTVRSISPSKGFAYRTGVATSPSELLMFNVTCVSQSEEVSLAQLHLHRRRLARHQQWPNKRRVLAPPYRVRLYQLGGRGGRTTQLASVPVPHATRGGWHSLDITPVLRELLLSNIHGPQLLGVRFEAPKGRQLPAAHFLKQPSRNESGNSPAFLVVFSEDVPDNGIADDGTETHVRLVPPHTHAIVEMIHSVQSNLKDGYLSQESIFQQALVQPANKTDEDFYIESSDYPSVGETDTSHRHKHKHRQYEDDENNDIQLNPNAFEQKYVERKLGRHHNNLGSIVTNMIEVPSAGSRRVLRSILDNELPDGELSPTGSFPMTSPEPVLTSRSIHKQKPKHSTIPLPPGQSSGSGKRTRGNKKRKGRDRKKGDIKKKQHHRANGEKENDRRSSSPHCERKSMNVDFHEIGWDNYIVAPSHFEAYYCSGECHQTAKHLRNLTNHAMIQSMVHNGHSDIPYPCCVPDQLSSISMLYSDDFGNVILKNYVDMVVQTCACR